MDADTLTARWASIESAVEEHAMFPPGALRVSWGAIATGRVEKVHRAAGVTGVGLLGCSQAEAWLAVTDDDPVDRVKGLTQFPLRGAWSSEKWLYQLLDLPWPIADRHWVLHTSSNAALARASGAWERSWSLAPEWLAQARSPAGAERWDAAVVTPTNEGSWLLVAVDSANTLALYQARVDLGGAVPADAAEAYAAATLADLYRTTTHDGQSMRTRYRAGCTPQPAPDGTPIPCFPG